LRAADEADPNIREINVADLAKSCWHPQIRLSECRIRLVANIAVSGGCASGKLNPSNP
jgi:hypothetical protein